jgi:putative protease
MQEVEERIGVVKRFFPRVSVAAIELTEGTLAVGDTLHFKGRTTDFEERVESMQIDREDLERAEARALVGVKVKDRVREKDVVYRKVLH